MLLQLFISSEHSVQIQLELCYNCFNVFLMDPCAFLNKESNYSQTLTIITYKSLCSQQNNRRAKQVSLNGSQGIKSSLTEYFSMATSHACPQRGVL